MPNTTSKSHKSRKAGEPAKPRQRKIDGVIAIPSEGSLPVVSPSSDAQVTTALVPTDSSQVDFALPPEKQSWYRKPDSPLKKQSEKIAVMRAAGHPVAEIAKRLKTTEANVRYVEYIARKNGWYDAEGEPVDIDAELAYDIDRKVVRNISKSLDGEMTNWQTHEMTIAAAKGRGMFKNHDKGGVDAAAMTVVAIRVEMPALGAGDQKFVEANVGGVPAYTEGEVADVRPLQFGHGGGEDNEAHSAPVPDTATSVSGSR